MEKTIFYGAAIGWGLSLVVHLLSLADVNVTDAVPFVWLLHVGMFAVFLPMILKLRKDTVYQDFQRNGGRRKMNPLAAFRIVLRNAPVWMRRVVIGCFVYAFVNFLLFAGGQPGSADFEDGRYILHNRGVLIREISKEEYDHYTANVTRGFSGIWLLFYSVSAAAMCPIGMFDGKNDND